MNPLEQVLYRLVHSIIFGFAGTLTVSLVLLSISMKLTERRAQERTLAKVRGKRQQRDIEEYRNAMWNRYERKNMR